MVFSTDTAKLRYISLIRNHLLGLVVRVMTQNWLNIEFLTKDETIQIWNSFDLFLPKPFCHY